MAHIGRRAGPRKLERLCHTARRTPSTSAWQIVAGTGTHKEYTQIIRDNQAVYVEDAVSGLERTRLAKPVHDAGWTAVAFDQSHSLRAAISTVAS